MINTLKLPKIKNSIVTKDSLNDIIDDKDITNPNIKANKFQKLLKNITDKDEYQKRIELLNAKQSIKIKITEMLDLNSQQLQQPRPIDLNQILSKKKQSRAYLDSNFEDSEANDDIKNMNSRKDDLFKSVNQKSISYLENKIGSKYFSQRPNKWNKSQESDHNKDISSSPNKKKILSSGMSQTPTLLFQNNLNGLGEMESPLKTHTPKAIFKKKSVNQIYDINDMNKESEMKSKLISTKNEEDITKKALLSSPNAKNAYLNNSPTTKIDELKPKINLEIIVGIDEKLYSIMNEKNQQNVASHCKDYFQIFGYLKLPDVDKLFLDPNTNRTIRTYFLLERLSIFLLYEICNDDDNQSKLDNFTYYINNIMKYTYYNFLNYSDLIICRASPAFYHNKWLEKLKQCRNKANVDLQDKKLGMMQVNDQLIRSLLLWIKTRVTKRPEQLKDIQKIIETIESMQFGPAAQKIDECFMNLEQEKARKTEKSTGTPALSLTPGISSKPKIPPIEPNNTPEQLASPLKKEKTSVEQITKKQSNFQLPPLPPDQSKTTYSLILDLDETLIHYEEFRGKGRFFVRPYAELFLKEMSEYYELTVFTAAVKDYADTVLNILDKNGYVKHRLYRHHTIRKPVKNNIIKDLSKLGRDLTKTIIIDNSPENFRLQPDNGIEIKSWFQDPFDTELLDLMPLLKDIVINKVEDIRKSLKHIRETIKKKK